MQTEINLPLPSKEALNSHSYYWPLGLLLETAIEVRLLLNKHLGNGPETLRRQLRYNLRAVTSSNVSPLGHIELDKMMALDPQSDKQQARQGAKGWMLTPWTN